jgi:endoplasmic reticulum Man9GlcNAc2 1,2-alpha-mannosidase
MSFVVPQRLPDFDNRERRQYENWTHVSHPTRSNSAFTYKDKPFYGGVHPARKKRWYTSKWFIGSICTFFVFSLMHKLMPGTQHDFDEEVYRHQGAHDWDSRRERVKEVFMYSWKGYVNHAWGKDEYRPISGSGKNMIPEGNKGLLVGCLLMNRHGLDYC